MSLEVLACGLYSVRAWMWSGFGGGWSKVGLELRGEEGEDRGLFFSGRHCVCLGYVDVEAE